MKKRLLLSLAVIVLLTIAVGCTKESEHNRGSKQITLSESWGFEQFLTVVTPANSKNYGLATYLANFYETLVNYQDGQIVPGLAESWNLSSDGLVYTFHLKQGIKFSDGADLDAGAVKRNLEMIPILSGEYNGAFAFVTSLFKEFKVLDRYTIEIHLTTPYYGALHDFTKVNPLAMMSPNAFNEDDTISEQILTATMGTGPYMYAGQNDGSSFTFVQNPNYHGPKPDVAQFRVKVIPDNQSKALALRNGEIDLIFGWDKITYDGFKEFSADKRYGTKVSNENGMTRYIGFNAAKAPFNDRQVRLAVSHAIDKTSICDNLFYGIESKADTLLNRSLPYCDVEVEPYQYDLEKANKILDEAGWRDIDGDGIREKDGQRLTGEILYTSGLGTDEDLILTISRGLKKLGMDLQERGLDMMAWYAESQQGNFTLSYNTTYYIPDVPFTLISNMNSEMQVDKLMAQGLAHLPDGNQLIIELNTMVDQQEIQQTYSHILGEIHQNVSFVPISYIKELVVFNADKITDYQFFGQPWQVNIAGIKLR